MSNILSPVHSTTTRNNQPTARLDSQTYREVKQVDNIEERLAAVKGLETKGIDKVSSIFHPTVIESVGHKVSDIRDGKDPLFTLDEMQVLRAALDGSVKQLDQAKSPLKELDVPDFRHEGKNLKGRDEEATKYGSLFAGLPARADRDPNYRGIEPFKEGSIYSTTIPEKNIGEFDRRPQKASFEMIHKLVLAA